MQTVVFTGRDRSLVSGACTGSGTTSTRLDRMETSPGAWRAVFALFGSFGKTADAKSCLTPQALCRSKPYCIPRGPHMLSLTNPDLRNQSADRSMLQGSVCLEYKLLHQSRTPTAAHSRAQPPHVTFLARHACDSENAVQAFLASPAFASPFRSVDLLARVITWDRLWYASHTVPNETNTSQYCDGSQLTEAVPQYPSPAHAPTQYV
ncbi:hypothetical protein AC579_3008 [Pseudocercospora musae]|uniref:Uncharacterized protein n=1 Tax=Pseudocercospora musae TaxID=113226 RepID=A0A139GTK5_9PEZI|nr:hypothetical protein AC579_3008 [Pseudocercospora musae]